MNPLNSKKKTHCFIFSVDRKLRITSWSKEFENKYGKSICEIKGIPYHEIMPMLKNGGTDMVMKVLKSGRSLTLKGQKIVCFCGRNKTDMRITPLKDKAGKITGANIATIACPDATTLNELRQSHRLLHIGKIAATLAHGVRSPLNAIKGCVTYIREKYTQEEKLLEFLKIMEEEISHLDNFIANFLSTSISDKSSSAINLEQILKKIKILISLQAQSRNIKLRFEYGQTHPVMINSFHLEHAILNVINNAMDSMPSGGLLTVKTQMKNSSQTNFVAIEISDTGCGMTKDRHANMDISSKNKGRGLGLFITREILRSNGGYLEMKSNKGLGTSVKLYLPSSHN